MTSSSADRPDPPGRMPVLDDVDRAIVAALSQDGRMSMRALAATLHISRAGAYTRVQRLEQAGVITGYTVQIDPQRYGYGLSAYVHLKISQPAWKQLRTRLLACPRSSTRRWSRGTATSCCWCGPATRRRCGNWS